MSATSEYFAYISLREKFLTVKLDSKTRNEILMKLLELEVGDFLHIKGLGHMQVVNHYFKSDTIDDIVYNEIGITCNQIKGA